MDFIIEISLYLIVGVLIAAYDMIRSESDRQKYFRDILIALVVTFIAGNLIIILAGLSKSIDLLFNIALFAVFCYVSVRYISVLHQHRF